MKQNITRRSFIKTIGITAGLALLVPLMGATLGYREASEPDEIVAMDLLTLKEPRSQAESRLRVIRLTTRSGAMGYGDYLDYGLPDKDMEETLARLVNRYAEQGHKKDLFLTDPSMRAVGGAHTVLGQSAEQVLNAQPVMNLRYGAFFPEKDLARCGRARENQDWSSPFSQPCSTSQRKTVHAGCGSVRRFR